MRFSVYQMLFFAVTPPPPRYAPDAARCHFESYARRWRAVATILR